MQFSLEAENLFYLLGVNSISECGVGAFMNFAVEDGSHIAVVGYRFFGGSHEDDCMTIIS